jgi:hypothetical protein
MMHIFSMEDESVPSAPGTMHHKIVQAALSAEASMMRFTRSDEETFKEELREVFPEMNAGLQAQLWKDPYWRQFIQSQYALFDADARCAIDSLVRAENIDDSAVDLLPAIGAWMWKRLAGLFADDPVIANYTSTEFCTEFVKRFQQRCSQEREAEPGSNLMRHVLYMQGNGLPSDVYGDLIRELQDQDPNFRNLTNAQYAAINRELIKACGLSESTGM